MKILSLQELTEFLRRVVALNFQQPIWVTAEIGQLSESRGHIFLDLLQKSDSVGGEIVANAQAILWSKTYARQRQTHGKTLDEVLQQGLQVKLKVQIEFDERFGLRLLVEEIDPTHTFGQAELDRRRTLENLKKSGLLQKNGSLRLPPVLQKIAVVSSENAAGWVDFRQHLAQNFYGYHFDLQLFTASVQGANAAVEVPAAFEKISKNAADFDCAVVLRGGGARLDLAVFDHLEICKSVARCPLPVFTGIGHEEDETLLDLCAHTSLKTPTAAADFLVQHNFQFENRVNFLGQQIGSFAENQLEIKHLQLSKFENEYFRTAREQVRRAEFELNFSENLLPQLVSQNLKNAARSLDEAELICRTSDPAAVLRRGFTMTKSGGKLLRSAKLAEQAEVLETIFADGSVFSKK